MDKADVGEAGKSAPDRGICPDQDPKSMKAQNSHELKELWEV